MSDYSWAGGSGRVNKRWTPSFPCCPVSRQCPWKKTMIEKRIVFERNTETQKIKRGSCRSLQILQSMENILQLPNIINKQFRLSKNSNFPLRLLLSYFWPLFKANIHRLFFNPIQDGDGGGGRPPYQFFSCNFYKRRNIPQNFLSFSFNPFDRLV